MEKLLYLSNIDWNWIKQRPQFIAENLSKSFDILVLYQKGFRRSGYQNNMCSLNIKKMIVLPFVDKIPFIRKVNVYIKKLYLNKILNDFRPKYIYVTHPLQLEWIPKCDNYNIIYDCMDDYYGLLICNTGVKNKLLYCEKKLCDKAKLVIFSSKYLYNNKIKKYGKYLISKSIIVYNAFDGKVCDEFIKTNDEKIIVTYFGTVSNWFDFDLLNKSLQDFPNLYYKIYGPIREITTKNVDERIQFCGTIPHDELFERTKNADCFILPFKISEAIEAVDPVKVYEYINFNRHIIAVKYDEILRFEKFVDYYGNYSEYRELINNLYLKKKLKYTNFDRINFLNENTWDERAKLILESLKKI